MKVLIAGGAKPLVFGTVQRHLLEHNIEIGWHASDMDSKSYNGIPKDCEGVIVMRDMIGHTLANRVVADANSRGLPNVCIESKWSKAKPLLELNGFFKDAVDGSAPPPVGQDQILQETVKYLVATRKQGWNGKFSDAVLHIGATLGLNVVLGHDLYEHALLQAINQQPIKTKSKPPHRNNLLPEAKAAVVIVIESNFDLLLDVPSLIAEAKIEFPKHAEFLQDTLVNDTIAELRQQWSTDLEKLKLAGLKWLVQRYRRFKDTGEGWPAWSHHAERTKIFGKAFTFADWKIAATARGQVFGTWADDNLCTPWSGFEFFKTLRPEVPMTDETFRGLLEQGILHSIHMPHGGSKTTEKAVREYADTYHPISAVTADVASIIPQSSPSTFPKVNAEVMAAVAEVVDSLDMPQPPTIKHDVDLYAMADLIETGIAAKLQQAQTVRDAQMVSMQQTVDQTNAAMARLEGSLNAAVAQAAQGVTDKVQHFLSGAKVTLADSDRIVVLQFVQKALEPVTETIQHLKGQVATLVKTKDDMHKAVTDIQQFQQHTQLTMNEIQIKMTAGFEYLASLIQKVQPAVQPAPDEAALTLGKALLSAKGAEVHLFIGEHNPKG